MLGRLGRFAIRRRWSVLIATLFLAIASGMFGGTLFNEVKTGGFDDPNSEAVTADDAIREAFGHHEPNIVILVDAKGTRVDDPAIDAAGKRLSQSLQDDPTLEDVVSYFTTGAPPLVSDDRTQALILARVLDSSEETVIGLRDRYGTDDGTIAVAIGGQSATFVDINKQIESDLARAEAISFPVVFVLLVFVFGGLIAAGVPLLVGAFAIVATFLILRLLTLVVDVSVYSINLTTMMGLGLGIDYSLFILTRYREELRKGLARDDAIVRSVETAGRTVLFSALIVASSLSAMLVFPLFFLRSFAYAGIAVVVTAMLASLITVPALLAVLGDRINKLNVLRRKPPDAESLLWARIASLVMRRPIVVTVVTAGLLLALGSPFLHPVWGDADDRVLPTDAPVRVVSDAIRENFSSRESAALTVIAPNVGDPIARSGDIEAHAVALSTIEGVARVDAATGSYTNGELIATPSSGKAMSAGSATRFVVIPSVEPISPAGEALVREIRATDAPFETLTTGPSAYVTDNAKPLVRNLPWAALIIATSTLVLLFLMTGSVVLPLKALMLSALSLTATFGAMVWIFQEGHLADVLGFTPTGTLDRTNPIVMFCVAFGLSMDYEVFLLSRIKEEHERTGDTRAAVAAGLARTGRLVSAAALLMAVVFAAFATSEVTFVKMIGLGLAIAVIVDATIIRAALVPAFMRLMGGGNWWAPRPLRKLHDRFGLHESPASTADSRPLDGTHMVTTGGSTENDRR